MPPRNTLADGLGRAAKAVLQGNETAILDDAVARFEPYITKQLIHKACMHRPKFYKNVIKLFVPAVLTWLIIQSIAAAMHSESRWVNIISVAAAFVVFAISWFWVVDRSWSSNCAETST